MPSVSEKDLDSLRQRVAKKREKLIAEQAKVHGREVEISNEITQAQLLAEEARLDADLAVAAQSARVSAVKEGASAPLEAARAAMRQAVEVKDAVENADGPVAPVPTSTEVPVVVEPEPDPAKTTKGGK